MTHRISIVKLFIYPFPLGSGYRPNIPVLRGQVLSKRLIVLYRAGILPLCFNCSPEPLMPLFRETMKRVDLEQAVAKPTELGANLSNQDGLSRLNTVVVGRPIQ